MSQGVDCPDVFDDEEGNPLPLVNVADIDTANDDRKGIDYEEGDIKLRLMTRGFFVISYVEKEFS